MEHFALSKLERAILLLNKIEIDLKEYRYIKSIEDLEKIVRKYKRKLIEEMADNA
jgi:hypothetical protein